MADFDKCSISEFLCPSVISLKERKSFRTHIFCIALQLLNHRSFRFERNVLGSRFLRGNALFIMYFKLYLQLVGCNFENKYVVLPKKYWYSR